MQQVVAMFNSELRYLELPDPNTWLIPGVLWGRSDDLLSPAYWVATAWAAGDVSGNGFQLGKTLAEEVAACLLGGHGLPAEVGLAAFYRVRDHLQETEDEVIPESQLLSILSKPLIIRGRPIRYRFARQRSSYLARSLRLLCQVDEASLDDVAFRDRLCALPGIGLKTASWIVRNRRGSDAIAILDVHVLRACRIMGLFPDDMDPGRHYLQLEQRFLDFCIHSNVRASVMDAVMWSQMRNINIQLLSMIVDNKRVSRDVLLRTQKGVVACPEAMEAETIGRQVARRGARASAGAA